MHKKKRQTDHYVIQSFANLTKSDHTHTKNLVILSIDFCVSPSRLQLFV